MIRENGTEQAKRSDQDNLFLIQKGNHLQLIADFSFTTDRKIRGCAHFPSVDKENELILTEAVKKALPQYMQHPILHIQHTERPVGTVTKAEIDAEGALQIEGSIFDTPDTNDVWTDIESGKLNKFSIFGRRDHGTYECSIPPDRRISPCVTKALTLFSISIVGENAMNPNTFLEVAKGDTTDTEDETKEEEGMEKCGTSCKKGDDDGPLQDSRNPSLMQKSIDEYGERLTKIEEALTKCMYKAEEDSEMEDEKKEETVEKAAVVEEVKPEFIIKADLDSEIRKAVDDVRKAYDEKFVTIEKAYTDLKATVESMKKETIEKGGHVVIITKEQVDANLKVGHLDMIGEA